MRRLFGLLLLSALPFLPGCDLEPITDGDGTRGIALELVAQALTAPVALVEAPDSSGRLFVADQIGLIRVVAANGNLLDQPFLDLRSRMVTLNPAYDERGLLGLAFHPDFRTNGLFYVYYSAPLRVGAPAGFNHTSHVSEFRATPVTGNQADAASERVLLRVDQPQSNHNGGTLAFGPDDGFLYISLGDGGGRDDEGLGHVEDWFAGNAGGNGQDLTQNLLGSILRIDPDAGSPYAVPADNPFVGGEGLDEIWAYGFRNPYRFSFDPGGANDLLVGDAGQDLWEEVSRVTRGGNYGWNVKEGTHCFDAEDPEHPPATCPNTEPDGDPLIDPVIEFANANQPDGIGLVVVGGHVYRGEELDNGLEGEYFFGSWSARASLPDGRVYRSEPRAGTGLWTFREVEFTNTPTGRLGHYLLSFGQDQAGEIYLLTTDVAGPTGNSGKVYRLVDPD
ncbi:MAG TPA: PQQ-dependent sugar dehydrogenase [Longimicrobiaceae bacterium]|nr:PQQ-dependent sugar dehydrogenase [Longimicrobiaceae bacterium]